MESTASSSEFLDKYWM